MEDLPAAGSPAAPGVYQPAAKLPPALAGAGAAADPQHPAGDAVDCAVFAPPEAVIGEVLLVQVFLYQPAQAGMAKAQAKEFDPEARRHGWKTLELEVPRGSWLDVRLDLPGLEVDGPDQRLLWRGAPEAAQFAVRVPPGRAPGPALGKVSVALGGVPIGALRFKLALVRERTAASAAQPLGEAARRFRRAFISYSSRDRAEVLKRVQMLKAGHVEFFQDVLDLDPGQRWEQELYRHIDECDVFYLFWSSAASESPWVQKEMRYAWERKAGDDGAAPEFVPIPIEGPPIPLPPDYLQHLHFNDALLAHIRVSDP